MKQVGIIGGAGFIGSHITKIFLEQGFQVKVSTRDLAKKERYRHLLGLGNAGRLRIVELDVENREALNDFVAGCAILIHGGTPFQLDTKDPKTELFDPTINGTRNFLEVVKANPNIEKIIFIASVAAYNTNFPLPPDNKGIMDAIDENDAKFISQQSHPYGQAKFLANQAVQKFIQDNPGLTVEISSVSPVFVMGRSLSGREDSTSGGMQHLFKSRIAPNAFIQMIYDQDLPFAGVDVTDVADAVLKLVLTTGSHGKNYLLSSESYPVSDISRMLNGVEPLQAPRIVYRSDLAKRELNAYFRPVKETLNAYAE